MTSATAAAKIIDRFGIRIAYVRKNSHYRCPYRTPWFGGGHKGNAGILCPVCLGTGNIIASETRIARKSTERVELPSSSGVPKRIDHVWYFKNNVTINSGDYIVECRWNGSFPNIKPTAIVDIFRIDDIDRFTKEYEHGLVYTRAFTTRVISFDQGPDKTSATDDEKTIYLRQLSWGIVIVE